MALSLPYNLVFVPLDVLTAEELNNLMADINFISNQFPLTSDKIGSGAIGSTQLASNAVTSAKIASSAVTHAELAGGSVQSDSVVYSSVFGAQYVSNGSISTALGTSMTQIGYVVISGFPLNSTLFATATLNCTGSSTDTAVSAQLYNGSLSSPTFSQTNAWGKHVALSWTFTKSSSVSYLYLRAQKDNSSSVTAVGYTLTVFRIG